ncbi:hypothetical protein BPAE_0291g00050 [Botrytis paeoniae]|uniref:Uncharacterized protein n=1 Tax=Botrytis paeoniae TaxID=278948 RepID=A0A4Z1F861_9HELO|nr:hypothetical protein BPAE_0291g00050 [Botrytis paeoniae]
MASNVNNGSSKRKQAGFEKGEVKRTKQGNGPQTQAEKEMHDFERFRRTLALWYNSPNGSDHPAKSHPLGVLNGRSAAVLVLRARDAPVLPGLMESWSRSVRVKLDMFSQAPCLRVILDSEHSFVIRPANIIKGDRPVWTQNHDYKLDLSEDEIEGTKADLARHFTNHYHCPIQGAIDEIIKISRSGSVVKALSILGFDLGGESTWETRTADIKDPRYDQMEAFMTQLNQGVMHAAVCRINSAYSWYRDSIGTKLGQLSEAWQAHPDGEVRHQPWMMLKGMDEELRAYSPHDSRKAFGSLREMEIALSLCIIHENMWENYSISKYFNNDTKHQCRADRSRDQVMLHVGVDKDENFVMPSVPTGTRIRFWVVPLEVDEDAEEPAPPAEDEWIKVRGKKVRKPVIPLRGWMPEDQVTQAQVIEVATELDFVLGFHCKDENSRNAFQRGNCLPSKNVMQENLQNFFMGHESLHEGAAIHNACRGKMSNDQKNAFDYLTKSMEMNRQQLQAWRLTFYESCYATFIQDPLGTGKTHIVGGQGLGLALCGVRDWFEIVYLPTRGTTIFDLKETTIDWDNATLGMIQEGENQTGNSNVDDYALWKHIVRTMRDDSDNGTDEAKKTRARGWLDALAKFKSGQNELVLSGITPADQYNDAIIGFLSAWNRMNVRLTRAQSCLVMFGNLDVWRSQLPVLVKKCKNFGFMVIDLVDRGDIIDALMIDYDKKEYEKRILEEWYVKRAKAIDYQSKDENGIEFDLPAFGVEEDNKAEKDAMDDLTNNLEISKVSDQVGSDRKLKEAELMNENDLDWEDKEPVEDPTLVEKVNDMLGELSAPPPPQAVQASVPPPPPAVPRAIPSTAPLIKICSPRRFWVSASVYIVKYQWVRGST